MMSSLWRIAYGRVRACIGVGSVNPSSWSACSKRGDTPSSFHASMPSDTDNHKHSTILNLDPFPVSVHQAKHNHLLFCPNHDFKVTWQFALLLAYKSGLHTQKDPVVHIRVWRIMETLKRQQQQKKAYTIGRMTVTAGFPQGSDANFLR